MSWTARGARTESDISDTTGRGQTRSGRQGKVGATEHVRISRIRADQVRVKSDTGAGQVRSVVRLTKSGS